MEFDVPAMKTKTVYLETGLVLVGTALTVVTTIVMPADQHFHVTGALLIVTGAYAIVARKLPDSWWYSVTSAILGLIGGAYFIYAFATRSPGIRHFFIIFFIEVAMLFSVLFVAFRQVRQIIIYNMGVQKCKHKMARQSDPELVDFSQVKEAMDMAVTPSTPTPSIKRKKDDDDVTVRSESSISHNSSVTTPCNNIKT